MKKTAIFWILVLTVITSLFISIGTVTNQEKSISTNEKVVIFSTGCTDIADLWSNLSQDKKIEKCNKVLNQQTADLKNMGFEPEDCGVIEAEAKRCTEGRLGTHLVCTYTCEK